MTCYEDLVNSTDHDDHRDEIPNYIVSCNRCLR